MQDCFKQYPEIYGAELTDDAEEPADDLHQVAREETQEEPASIAPKDISPEGDNLVSVKPAEENGVPKAWEDATDADKKDAKEDQPGVQAKEEKEEKKE